MSIHDFEKPSLTTDIVLLRVADKVSENKRKNSEKELQVLLIKRKDEPCKDCYSLPGGFVNIDEPIYVNVRRKLYEKTEVSGDFYIEQLYTWGELDRDSRGRVISVSYLGLCNNETYTEKFITNEWLNVYEVLEGKYGDLAFDHKQIIEYALERIKGKIEYTDIAFNLLPEKFTLSECKAVYELILGKTLLNFKRGVAEYIEPLNEYQEGKQFRPAQLFKVNKDRKSKF
jgi:ADP-ribose pyrophosphatase YjhB (NUDIX family)